MSTLLSLNESHLNVNLSSCLLLQMTDTCYQTTTPQHFSTDPTPINTTESRQFATMGEFS